MHVYAVARVASSLGIDAGGTECWATESDGVSAIQEAIYLAIASIQEAIYLGTTAFQSDQLAVTTWEPTPAGMVLAAQTRSASAFAWDAQASDTTCLPHADEPQNELIAA